MNSCHIACVVFVFCFLACVLGDSKSEKKKCHVPAVAPKNIEKVINQCQDEIKLAVISEAVEFLKDNGPTRRTKRDVFSQDEKRIAGCLLQCVYRKMNAVNESGFPTQEGLVSLYTEGVDDKTYYLATVHSVSACLALAQRTHITTAESLDVNGKTCDVAFDVFDCVSDRVAEYCGQTP